MLASITPLGERGRHATWGITVIAFLIGSTAAAVAGGAALGAAGGAVVPRSFGADARLVVLAVASATALLFDARAARASRSSGGRGARVPGPRRQVNERWLDSYRGWVYGLGFGAQLGLGVTTVVSSAATYVALAAAVLSGSVVRGALVLGSFGALRGLTLLSAARVRRPQQLHALHARLERWRAPAVRYGVGALAAITVLALVGSVA